MWKLDPAYPTVVGNPQAGRCCSEDGRMAQSEVLGTARTGWELGGVPDLQGGHGCLVLRLLGTLVLLGASEELRTE